jgi:Na+-driven multidrug efflux pump
VLFSTIYVLLVRIVQPFGTPAVAALGVGHKVEGVNYMVAVGFALAAQTMVGQNLGAGNPARARAAGWTTAWITIVPLGLCSLIFLAAAAPLAGVFTTDPAVVADAALYIRIIAWSQVFMAVELVLEASMSGAGYTVWPMVWIVGLSAIRIPIAAAIAVPFGLAGVWWTLSVTAVGRGIAMATLWRWGAWGTAKA